MFRSIESGRQSPDFDQATFELPTSCPRRSGLPPIDRIMKKRIVTTRNRTGLVPRQTPDPTEAVFDRALALREALYDVALDPRPGAAWDVVAAEAGRAAAAATLTPEGWRLPATPELP